MDNRFFERPILNFPVRIPIRYWELGEHDQPTQQIIEPCRQAEFIARDNVRLKGVLSNDYAADLVACLCREKFVKAHCGLLADFGLPA